MNLTEKRMLEILKELRDEHNVLAIKAEFEAEGSRTDELVQLNEVIFRADMQLFIKIGGCEAVRDLDQCRLLGATGIMAPMIETPFAMKKYVGAAQKVYGDQIHDISWIINAETKTCKQNLKEILDEGEGFLNVVSVGRVDLSSSMGLTRADINNETMFETTKEIAEYTRKRGYLVNFGGGISFEAIPFIRRIAPYVDRFETRKVVFGIMDDEKRLEKAIYRAMEFETLYLQNKCAYYNRMAKEDEARMQMFTVRLNQAKERLGIL